MPSTLLRESTRGARSTRVRGRPSPTSRLGWVGLILGMISMDLEALVFLAALFPVLGWFSQELILYNPSQVITLAMLALGGPPAIIGLVCAGARRPTGWRGAPAVAGIAICSLGLAIPISYAAFAAMYLRGLI